MLPSVVSSELPAGFDMSMQSTPSEGFSASMHLQYRGKTMFDCCYDGCLPVAALLWEQASRMQQQQQQQRYYDIVNVEDKAGYPPLHWASFNARVPIMRFLICKGANINRKAGPEEVTALHWAACTGNLQAIATLLENGADADIADVRGYTAMMHATQYGHTLAVHLIVTRALRQPVRTAVTDTNGHTCVHWAAYKGYLNTLRLLVEQYHVPVSAVDDKQRTALHWAARKGYTKCCHYLLSRGVSLNAKDNEDHTALQWATELNQTETTEYLQQCGKVGWEQAAVVFQSTTQRGVSTLVYLRENIVQLNRLVVASLAIAFHYFVVSWSAPLVVSLLFPVVAWVVPSPRDTKVIMDMIAGKPPAAARAGGNIASMDDNEKKVAALGGSLHDRVRDMAVVAACVMMIGFFYYTVVTCAPLVTFALYSCGGRLVVGGGCAVAATLLAVATSSVDPGFEDVKTLVDANADVFESVKNGDFDRVIPETLDSNMLEATSTRGHECKQLDRVVMRLDHYNRGLDAAIGHRNHRLYLAFLFTQLVALISFFTIAVQFAWVNDAFHTLKFSPMEATTATTTTNTTTTTPTPSPSLCYRFLAFTHLRPILTFVLSLASYVTQFPSPVLHVVLWLGFYNAIGIFVLAMELGFQVYLISHNVTFYEVFISRQLPLVGITSGPQQQQQTQTQTQSQSQLNRKKSFYDHGSYFRNWVAFLKGSIK